MGDAFSKMGDQMGDAGLSDAYLTSNKKSLSEINQKGFRRDGKIRTCDLLVPNQAR